MTTISNLDSNYITRSRMREMITDAGFTPMGSSTEQPSVRSQPPTVGSDDAGSGAGASLSLALLDMDSAKAVRTTLSGEPVNTSYSENLLAELQEWSQKTPGDMIRAKFLEQMGITEEELAAMPPDQRKAIEDQIEQLIKQSLIPTEQQAENDGSQKPPATFTV